MKNCFIGTGQIIGKNQLNHDLTYCLGNKNVINVSSIHKILLALVKAKLS